ncbi:hypothetical protein DNTS_011854, partial [Danionella cerebrum]
MALEKFLLLPFRVRCFRLAGVRPMTLQVPLAEELAELVPASTWDSSASKYLLNLLQVSSLAEAYLREEPQDAIELYLTINGTKVSCPAVGCRRSKAGRLSVLDAPVPQICVNHELVAKKFGYFVSEAGGGDEVEAAAHTPVSLAWDIYSSPQKLLEMKGCCPLRDTGASLLDSRPETKRSDITETRPPGAPGGDQTTSTQAQRDHAHFTQKETDEWRESEEKGKPGEELPLNKGTYTIGRGWRVRAEAPEVFSRPSELSQSRSSRCGASSQPEQTPEVSDSETETHGLCGSCGNVFVSVMESLCFQSAEEQQEASEETQRSSGALAAASGASTEQQEPDVSQEASLDDLLVCSRQETWLSSPQKLLDVRGIPGNPVLLCLHIRAGETNQSLIFSDSRRSSDAELLSSVASPDLEHRWKTDASNSRLFVSRLMQILNPDPLNPEQEPLEAEARCSDPLHSGVLVHSALRIDPCTSLARAPVSEHFRKFLLRRKYRGPSVSESFCWPPVARGFDTVLVSHSGDDPLSYLPPLLMLLQTLSMASCLAARTGPRAVILCPGWEKVQTVLELLEDSRATHSLHPSSVLLGLDLDEPKKIRLHKSCQLLVTTPSSMVRLLEAQRFLFLRLGHLVLDEADVLFSQAPEQVSVMLKHFQKLGQGDERSSCPRQIIAAGKSWSSGIQTLVRDFMIHPSIVITAMEEAALYGKVHQRVQLCLDCEKISVLLSSLDFNPQQPQKTLIITSSEEETETVFKAVGNTAVFTLRAVEQESDGFQHVIDQWRKRLGRGTQLILVTSDSCLKALGIRDATAVVHYGFPGSPKRFGSRLFCMAQNFSVPAETDSRGEHGSSVAQSVLLLSELNVRHVCGVLRFLRRTGALLPPELLSFANGVQRAKEEEKRERELCCSLKSFGFCRDSGVCPERHTMNPAVDQPLLLHLESRTVTVLPLCIRTANVFSGRVVAQKEDAYEALDARMKEHFAAERLCAVEILKEHLYAVQEESIYKRVRVVDIPEKGEQLFRSATVCFIDEGRTQEVKSHQLLQLPERFQDLPAQAVEMVLCRVQPVDGELDWNPKVTRAVSLKIRGKPHQARVVMSLGNTLWVDPLVRVTRVPGLKTFINEYSVRTEILASGFGVSNPQHVELLRELFQREQEIQAPQLPELSAESSSDEAFRDLLSTCSTAAHQNQSVFDRSDRSKLELEEKNAAVLSDAEEERSTSSEGIAVASGTLSGDEAVVTGELRKVPLFNFQPLSFHPQIRWFQSGLFITVLVKLIDPAMQKCEFHSNWLLY